MTLPSDQNQYVEPLKERIGHSDSSLRNRREALAEKRERAKGYYRKKYFPKLYGITISQYEEMFERQHGKCGICRRKERNGKVLSVDHDHQSLRVRGLLCDMCNRGMGMFGEDIKLLRAAARYLQGDLF